MSVEIPKMAIALGPYGIAQGDVIEARVHLGATKEVSSWSFCYRIGIISIVLAELIRSVSVKTATYALAEARMFLRSLPLGQRA